jgi:dihydroorotate dehydrogenase
MPKTVPVEIGTATYLKGMGIYNELKKELENYMGTNHYTNLKEIIGAAHNQ